MKLNNRLILQTLMEIVQQEFNEKQTHILEIAERLFATKGFDGTSVRDIAHEADVNIAMISYYFGSKEKLMEALFKMRSAFIAQQLTEMLQNGELAPLEKMYRLIDYYLDRIMNHQHFHKIMVREQIGNKDSEISKTIREVKKRNQELIKKLITEGQKKGVFRKNIDIPLMMLTLFGTVNQFISTQDHYKEINNLQHLMDSEFEKLCRKKLSIHMKTLFKAILTYEQ